MTASPGALLALIVDDAQAVQVLAAWAATGCALADLEDRKIVASLSELSGVPFERTAICLRKLRAAQVLVDGGITELADRMLQSHVSARMGTGSS